MKGLLAIMMMVLPMLAGAQKIYKNEVDKFTGKRIVETKYETIADFSNGWGKGARVKLAVRYDDGTWFLPAEIKILDSEEYGENSGIILLLNNNETIVLKTLHTGKSKAKMPVLTRTIVNYRNDYPYYFTTEFAPNKKDIEKLKKHSIIDIRVTTLSHNYDVSVKKNNRNKLMKMVQLVESVVAK